MNLFLQAFDEGWMTDGRGKKVYLSDAIVIMTSNAGSEHFRKLSTPLGFRSGQMPMDQVQAEINRELERRRTRSAGRLAQAAGGASYEAADRPKDRRSRSAEQPPRRDTSAVSGPEERRIVVRPPPHVRERQARARLAPPIGRFRDDDLAVHERQHRLGVMRPPPVPIPLVGGGHPLRDDRQAAER